VSRQQRRTIGPLNRGQRVKRRKAVPVNQRAKLTYFHLKKRGGGVNVGGSFWGKTTNREASGGKGGVTRIKASLSSLERHIYQCRRKQPQASQQNTIRRLRGEEKEDSRFQTWRKKGKGASQQRNLEGSKKKFSSFSAVYGKGGVVRKGEKGGQRPATSRHAHEFHKWGTDLSPLTSGLLGGGGFGDRPRGRFPFNI